MHITIIEDELLLSDQISKRLVKKWYTTKIINSIKEYKDIKNIKSDIFIIDIWLRDWSWFDIIEDLRKVKKINSPIIITSWYDEVDKKVYWLDLWADDYIAKPYSIEELDARIRALLRRAFENPGNKVFYKSIELDLRDKIIRKSWEIIELTWRESQLVEYFLMNKWKLITKNELVTSVWWKYDELWVTDNNINVTFSKIRRKLGQEFNLKTIFNRWYILE